MQASTLTWAIAGITAPWVITRLFALQEAMWVVLAAFLLLALGLIGHPEARAGVVNGLDV